MSATLNSNQPSIDEINSLALSWKELRNSYSINLSTLERYHLQKMQEEYLRRMQYLITNHSRRYRRFENFEDLSQEGYESLILALNTFEPEKGNFVWWANQYIKTKLKRQANNHSSLRIPIAAARICKPFKVDFSEIEGNLSKSKTYNPLNSWVEIEDLKKAVNSLSDLHQQVVMRLMKESSSRKTVTSNIPKVAREMDLSQGEVRRIWGEASKMIRRYLEK